MWTAHANVVAYVIFQAPFSASFTSAVLFQDALILWPFSAHAHVIIGHTVFHNFFYSHTDIYGDRRQLNAEFRVYRWASP
jgi:hypothetical protein